jgi:hypothetical protein
LGGISGFGNTSSSGFGNKIGGTSSPFGPGSSSSFNQQSSLNVLSSTNTPSLGGGGNFFGQQTNHLQVFLFVIALL